MTSEGIAKLLFDCGSYFFYVSGMIKLGNDQARKRRKQLEGYWQITLCTLAPYGLNSINELEANLKWSDKNIFYPMQDQ